MVNTDQEKSFFEKVLEVTQMIPYGRVTSFGAIARYLGMAKSSRMVGWALNQSSFDRNFVPAHRVVNRNGELTGAVHFGGSNVMADLLMSEGINIVDNRVEAFELHFWNPSTDL